MNPRKNLISKVLNSIDLDADILPGLPVVELAGFNRVLIENHRSVIGYTTDCVHIRVKSGSICISGADLIIAKMSKEQLVICGEIMGIQLLKGVNDKR